MNDDQTVNKAKNFFRSYPQITAFFIGCMMCILLMLCIEGICYVLNTGNAAKKPTAKKYFTNGYYQSDDMLGYKPKASFQATASMTLQGETVYSVKYSIDEYCRRITPVRDHRDRNRYAIFFGGSFTFGEGVDDHQTLPTFFSRFSSYYMPYNYGFHGYGPQQMLAKLQSGNLRTEIQENTGILIYLYLPFHVKRVIGDMHVFNNWGKKMPYYTIDAQKNLVRKGSFCLDRPFVSQSYHLLGKSNFIKYFNINFPLRRTDRHYQLTARIIEESRKEFRQQFASDHFYVVLYPRVEQGREEARKIIPYFEKLAINYFDYTALFDPDLEGYKIVGDGHPSSKAYETLAKRLSQDLSYLIE